MVNSRSILTALNSCNEMRLSYMGLIGKKRNRKLATAQIMNLGFDQPGEITPAINQSWLSKPQKPEAFISFVSCHQGWKTDLVSFAFFGLRGSRPFPAKTLMICLQLSWWYRHDNRCETSHLITGIPLGLDKGTPNLKPLNSLWDQSIYIQYTTSISTSQTGENPLWFARGFPRGLHLSCCCAPRLVWFSFSDKIRNWSEQLGSGSCVWSAEAMELQQAGRKQAKFSLKKEVFVCKPSYDLVNLQVEDQSSSVLLRLWRW